MQETRTLGERALFDLLRPDQLPALTVRERRLLVGSLNFHALMAPGRQLRVHLYRGEWDTVPRTTDDATFDGLSRQFGSRAWSLDIRSRVEPEARVAIGAEAPSKALVAHGDRHLHVSLDDILSFDPPRDISPDPVRRVLRAIRARTPLLYDQLRDVELLRHRRSLTTRAHRRTYDDEFAPGGHHEDSAIVPAPAAPDGAPRAVLIGLHWFELGGAEKWAFETVRKVREAGMIPLVVSNRDSHQPWIGRPELDDAVLLPMSEPTVRSQTPGVEELLRGILRVYDVRGVVVHHNQWLYDRLHWIRVSRPGIPIVDSTHIVEYRGGGFPRVAAQVDDAISLHHVISPTLARWMTDVQDIAPEKVVMAPLVGLTADLSEAPEFRPRTDGDDLVVAFVGRMARQKAPEVFVEMASRLIARGIAARFVMHGDGELAGWVDDLIERHHLRSHIARRDSSVPVPHTLAEAHVLVVPSHNEGLTLTTLEAIRKGVPVISTDVGAQRDLVPARALFPRDVHRAVRVSARLVAELAADEAGRERLWRDEYRAEQALVGQTPAGEWFSEEIAAW